MGGQYESYSIEVYADGEWQAVGSYPDTVSTAERHARSYAIERGRTRIVDRVTDEVIGEWRRIGMLPVARAKKVKPWPRIN